MEISLCTDGHDHYVFSYGKQDLYIVNAPVSILKKFVKADCFEVIEPKESGILLPAIRLKNAYTKYVESEERYGVLEQQDFTIYHTTLCTRKNELLQHYAKIIGKPIFKLVDLVHELGENYQYPIGVNYGKTGIQLFIENEDSEQQGKKIEGKQFFYPFLINEFETDLKSLKKRWLDGWMA